MGAALAVRFRVVRQLSVAGMQQRNRNRPSSLPSIPFSPFFPFLFYLAPARPFIFIVIIIVIIFGRLQPADLISLGGRWSPAMPDSGGKRETDREKERKGGRLGAKVVEGAEGERKRRIYACIAMHHPSFVRETKGHRGVRYLSCFAYGRFETPASLPIL